MFTEGHQGNAVLSRFPISSQQNHDVSIIGHEPRGLLHALLSVPGIPGPGVLLVVGGLALLGREFHWARRANEWLLAQGKRIMGRNDA